MRIESSALRRGVAVMVSTLMVVGLSGVFGACSLDAGPCTRGADTADEAFRGFLAAAQAGDRDELLTFLAPGNTIDSTEFASLRDSLAGQDLDSLQVDTFHATSEAHSYDVWSTDGTIIGLFQVLDRAGTPGRCSAVTWGISHEDDSRPDDGGEPYEGGETFDGTSMSR